MKTFKLRKETTAYVKQISDGWAIFDKTMFCFMRGLKTCETAEKLLPDFIDGLMEDETGTVEEVKNG